MEKSNITNESSIAQSVERCLKGVNKRLRKEKSSRNVRGLRIIRDELEDLNSKL